MLDPISHAPISTGMVLKKIANISSPGYVVAIRPRLVSGEAHLVFVTGTKEVFYLTYDWSGAVSTAVKLYENVEFPVPGIFFGTSSELD